MALAAAAVAFVLAAFGSGLTSLWRALRKHDARSVLLACLSLVSLAILPIVFPFAVHASGGTGLGLSGTWFATLLTFQRNLATRAVSPLRIDIVAVLSWLFTLAMIAISAWASRHTRERVGLASAYLRLESVLTGASAVAMIVDWGALVAWGVSVAAVPAAIPCSHALQCFGPFVPPGFLAPEPSLSTTWWLTLVAMGSAMLRSAVAGLRAVQERRGLTAARAG